MPCHHPHCLQITSSLVLLQLALALFLQYYYPAWHIQHFLQELSIIFFKALPMVLVETDSTYLHSTILSTNRRRVHLACPSGGSLQVRVIKYASSSAFIMLSLLLCGGNLLFIVSSKPSSTSDLRTLSTVLTLR